MEDGSSPKKTKNFIDTLKDFKEIIGAVVIISGALTWVFAYFATKAQLEELRCIMRTNIEFVDGRMEAESLSRLLEKNLAETIDLDNKPLLNPEEKVKLGRLKLAASEISRKLTSAENGSSVALNKLKSDGCR